jgi:hypothetical protein
MLLKQICKNSNYLKFNISKQLFPLRFFSEKVVQMKLPDLGEGTKEATIQKWYKQEGELVEEVF